MISEAYTFRTKKVWKLRIVKKFFNLQNYETYIKDKHCICYQNGQKYYRVISTKHF